MFSRFICFLIGISFITSTYAAAIVTEPVPGADCSCISEDRCVNPQTKKYKCSIGNSDITSSNYSVNSNVLDPIQKNTLSAPSQSQPNINVGTSTHSNQVAENREIAQFIGIIIFGGAFLYFLPTFIVLLNSNRAHRPATILINIFLGWSVIGWFVALFLSLQSSIVKVQIIENNKI